MINDETGMRATVREVYASLEKEIEDKTKTRDHSRRRDDAVPKRTLSMIMEDKSKHFSQEFIHGEETDEGGVLFVRERRKHAPPRHVGGSVVEGIETSSKGIVSRGYVGLSDIGSISTLGNVSRQNGSKGWPPGIGMTSVASSKHFKEEDYETNLPHPLLEVPPLYWILKPYPKLLDMVKSIYKFRWHVSYPLQRRVVFSQYLRKFNIHMTWGELVLAIPVLLTVVAGIITTAVYPSVELSGHSARLALIFALITPIRNSLLTLLIGLPFERALWYHKLAGRLAFVNGILHTYVAHADSIQKAFFQFLVMDTMNASGTGLMLLIVGVTVTSLPRIRYWCFEFFYYVHIVFVAMMTVCAFYHSGILIPILAILWIGDLLCRKVVMACCRYPRKARIRVISDTVVELKFPKCKGFDYNAGQHISVAVPELDLTFHPFSIATWPRMPYVSVLIRKAGRWTSALHALATEQKEVSILVEGPNGSPNVDILNPKRYQSVLLISGGIGVTPIQSLCNQLVYEHSKGLRDLKKIRVVWTDRDPVLVNDVDVVRRNSSSPLGIPPEVDSESQRFDMQSLASGSLYCDAESHATGMASALLTHFPPSVQSDHELEKEYPLEEPVASRKRSGSKPSTGDASSFRAAFDSLSVKEILELQVYLTSQQPPTELAALPFLNFGRPNIPQILADMREEALEMGLERVAVFLCAPARLALICQNACVQYSDKRMQFDFHMEYQE